MEFWILAAVSLIICCIGFCKYVYFISLGYGFSIAAIGLFMPVMFMYDLSFATVLASLLFIVYGCRLGGYLLLREIKSSAYRDTMKKEIKDGKDMKLVAKVSIWVSCGILYVCQISPVLFRYKNGAGTDAISVVGCIVMIAGILLEAMADLQKSKAKAVNPSRFCDKGLYRIVRCPNYLGEVLFWTGVFLTGITALEGVVQWLVAVFGYVCIVYIMFGGARRLEIRQNKNYGRDHEYQEYVKKTPILIPLIPLYSVEKYKWLVG